MKGNHFLFIIELDGADFQFANLLQATGDAEVNALGLRP